MDHSESKHERNWHQILVLRNFANTYKFKNLHLTWESHFLQVLSNILHRQKALIFDWISVKNLQKFYERRYIIYIYIVKGGGVAELVARPPTDPKVHGLNHRGPKYS
jgi:hypothetical protein